MVGKRILGGLAVAVVALSFACAKSDPGITTAVKTKLAADDVVKAYRIDVDTKDRVVTLTGAVDTPLARERAVQIARATDGVSNVVDNLTVSPGVTPTTGIDDPVQKKASEAAAEAQKKAGDAMERTGEVMSDAAITTAVKTKFLADTNVSGLKINVDTKDGVVTLIGTVPTASEKTRAIDIARETKGVKSVKDELKIGK